MTKQDYSAWGERELVHELEARDAAKSRVMDQAQYLIQFALEVEYDGSRFAPKDVNRAAEALADYLNR